jgi:septal ring factor EnvC (AmiA/AmiB activator)
MILDHGEGFLSVYADNESLLRGVGDQVAADEVIASVGNTGGNAQSGLYFEMRYQGHPFDPLTWTVAR